MSILGKIKGHLSPSITQKKIFFLHVPKCGGSSLRKAIIAAYKPWRPSNEGSVFELNEKAAATSQGLSALNSGPSKQEVRKGILHYYMAHRKTKCILGHFPYSNSTFEAFGQDWAFVTVLRDPVSRWWSHYLYDKENGRIDLPPEQCEIGEFIKTKRAAEMGTVCTRIFSESWHLDPKELGEQQVLKSIEVLNKFSLVGTMSNSTGFVADFQKLFGDKLVIPHINKTQTEKRMQIADISGEIQSAVRELCKWDIKLYRSLFEND